MRLFNEMVDIGKKIKLSKGITRALSYVKNNAFGEYENYLKQLKDYYFDNPSVLEMIDNIDRKVRGQGNLEKTTKTQKPNIGNQNIPDNTAIENKPKPKVVINFNKKKVNKIF